MDKADRGSKHICAECATKFYDLNRTPAVCPKCGTEPVIAKTQKKAAPGRKTGRSTYWRYP